MKVVATAPLSTLLCLLSLLPASSRVYKEYDGSAASIDASTWDLQNAGCCNGASVKPAVSGLDGAFAPSLSDPAPDPSGGTSSAVRVALASIMPADGQGMQKIHYLIMTGNNFDAPQATSARDNTGYTGFAVKFDDAYQVAPPVTPVDVTTNRGTQIWQAWQGSGWPPVQLRTNETNGDIRLYLKMTNDSCRGSYKAGCTAIEYLRDGATGNDLTFELGRWYRIVLATRADPSAASSSGYVAAWVDNGPLPAAEWTGAVGYTPESEGGQAGTIDGLSLSFGMYRHLADAPVDQAVHFDRIKYAQTKEEALPYYTAEELAAMPTFDDVDDGYCSSNHELKDDRGKSMRFDSPFACLMAVESDSACIASPAAVSFGKGARAGRCRCDKIPSCSINGKGLGDDGFDRLSVVWPPQ
mmetsp:Transcript_42156/g.127898  ORF Transcript_42156/g.127898 Transcript_42156/m.127898 type:complete len:412 (-) Transcript_42156:244-1479(-)